MRIITHCELPQPYTNIFELQVMFMRMRKMSGNDIKPTFWPGAPGKPGGPAAPRGPWETGSRQQALRTS